jgi:predicted transposase YbfD/YdcC
VLQRHEERGGDAVLSLLSISHYRKHRLNVTLHALKVAWTQMTKQRYYTQWKERHGVLGYVKTLEMTHGKNGWNPHYHLVWFTERTLTDAERDQMDEELFQLWMHNVTKHTDRSVNHEANHVQKIRTVGAIANYLSKSIAFELTHGHTKDGKMPTQRTPFQIAKDYTTSFDERDEALWNEYLDAISGQRMITFSRGLSDLRTTESLLTDEEIAEMEDKTASPDEENKVVASFDLPNTPWFNKWWYTTNEHTKLLEALEEDGETGMNLFIEEIRRRFEE